jgi:nucleotide-binding universal stress UspA family protein
MTLLVALEAGEAGETLLASVRMLAHAGGWEVRAVHVGGAAGGPPLALPARLATNTEVRELSGDPAEVLLEQSRAGDVTILALNLRNAARKEGVGEVADALMRGAERPLLVARPGVNPVGALKRILVPLSGSPSTSEAMRFTEEHFCARGREIVVLHVATADRESEPGSMTAPRIVDQEHYEWSDWHEEFGRRFAACPKGGRHLTVVKAGAPAEVIVEEATTRKIDLIVLAWTPGSLAKQSRQVADLLGHAPCPLLLVPAATGLAL